MYWCSTYSVIYGFFILPPFHSLKVFDLICVPVKSDVEIGDRIVGQEGAENAGIGLRVWTTDVANLEVHFEGSTPLVTSDLNPNLIVRNHSIVPGKATIANVSTSATILNSPLKCGHPCIQDS